MWDVELAAYLGRLREKKPVVVTGDFNCAREPIDIHNAKRNVKSAGFTPEERASFQKVRFWSVAAGCLRVVTASCQALLMHTQQCYLFGNSGPISKGVHIL